MCYRNDKETTSWVIALWEYIVLVVCATLFLVYADGQGRFAVEFIRSWWAE